MKIKLIGLVTLIFTFFVSNTSIASLVRLDMDTMPDTNSEWGLYGTGSASVSGGILTIDTPSYLEFIQYGPGGSWNENVSNSRGWMVETRMKLDSSSTNTSPPDRGTVQLWINDWAHLSIFAIDKDRIRMAYPDDLREQQYLMDTTDMFHTYRIEGQNDSLNVYVDGAWALGFSGSWSGDGTQALIFGDGVGGDYTKSYWDYFMYDTYGDNPQPVPIPGAVWLFSIGIASLVGLKKKYYN